MILLIINDIFLFEIKFLKFQFLANFGMVFIYSVISIKDLPDSILVIVWIAMVVYLVLAILKERYYLDSAMSKLLHFLEVNLFEEKPLLAIFQTNPRYKRRDEDKQLKLFDF